MHKFLITTGSLLTLFGLLLGTVLNWFANPEIASDAHVAGVQHGMLLMIIGLAWSHTKLGKMELICALSVSAGLIGIFSAFLAGAVLGEPYPASSLVTNFLFIFSSWLLILGFSMFAFGLFRKSES